MFRTLVKALTIPFNDIPFGKQATRNRHNSTLGSMLITDNTIKFILQICRFFPIFHFMSQLRL